MENQCSCGKKCFQSCLSVCSEGSPCGFHHTKTPPAPATPSIWKPHCTGTPPHPGSPRHGTSLYMDPPGSDIWWPKLKTCPNLFTKFLVQTLNFVFSLYLRRVLRHFTGLGSRCTAGRIRLHDRTEGSGRVCVSSCLLSRSSLAPRRLGLVWRLFSCSSLTELHTSGKWILGIKMTINACFFLAYFFVLSWFANGDERTAGREGDWYSPLAVNTKKHLNYHFVNVYTFIFCSYKHHHFFFFFGRIIELKVISWDYVWYSQQSTKW